MAATLNGTLNLTQYDAFLKEIYFGDTPTEVAKKDKPLMEYLPKYGDFFGDTYVVPIGIGNPPGAAATLTQADTSASTSLQYKFVATARNPYYGVVKLGGEVMAASMSNAGSFAAARQREIDGMLDTMGQRLHQHLYGSGSGSLAQASNIVDGSGEAVITLANKADVHRFQLGQTLKANNTDNSTSMRAGTPQVTERSVSAGTITVDETVVATHSWGTTDFLFNAADEDAVLTGLAGWIPLSEPSATAHFGVDRTDDVVNLAGSRVDNSARSIEENMSELAMLITESGGNPDTCFMNPRAVHLLSQELGPKVVREDGGAANFGFGSFKLTHFGTKKPITVVPDWACPANRGYMLQKDTWVWAHLKELVHLYDDDGKIAQRDTTPADAIAVWGRSWSELLCREPRGNGVFSISLS